MSLTPSENVIVPVERRHRCADLLLEQGRLGRKIISEVEKLRKKYDSKLSSDIDALWWQFFNNYKVLQFIGIRDDQYYSEIEAAILKIRDNDLKNSSEKDAVNADYKVTQKAASKSNVQANKNCPVARFLEQIQKFHDYLFEERSNILICKFPKVLVHELEFKFGQIKENFENGLVKNDKKAQLEFSKVHKFYLDVRSQVIGRMHQKPKEITPSPPPTNLETYSSNSYVSLSKLEHVLLDNSIDRLLDQPQLNSKNSENITLLLNMAASCLQFITKTGMNMETAKLFINRIIIRKFDKNTLQQYESRIKKPEFIRTLDDVFDFLRHMIKELRKQGDISAKDPKTNSTPEIAVITENKAKQTKEEQQKKSMESDEVATKKVQQQQQGILVILRKSADAIVDTETYERTNRPILFVKPDSVHLYLPEGVNTISTDDVDIIFQAMNKLFRENKSLLLAYGGEDKMYFAIQVLYPSKPKSDAILEMHIQNLRANISLRTQYAEGKVILNLNTAGLSEPEIRNHYSSVKAPTSFKEFITPLLRKSNSMLDQIIIFPEDEQKN